MSVKDKTIRNVDEDLLRMAQSRMKLSQGATINAALAAALEQRQDNPKPRKVGAMYELSASRFEPVYPTEQVLKETKGTR